MNKTQVLRRAARRDGFFLLLLLLVALFWARRIPMGVATADECYYLNIPYRLLQGDSLFVDEWHVGQLSGVLLMPLLKLRLLLSGGSMDGIYLDFRRLYLAFTLLTAAIAYGLLRRERPAAAAVACAAFSLSAPFMVTALSYNTLGGMCMFLFCILCARELRHPRVQHFCQGILLALAVLCNPCLLLVYGVFAIASLVGHFLKGRGVFQLRSLLWLTLGAGVVLVLFLTFVLSRASLSDILRSLPHILSDPEHPSKTLLDFLRAPKVFCAHYTGYVWGMLILFAVGLAFRRLRVPSFVGMTLISLYTMYALLFADIYQSGGFNAVMLPLTPLGFVAHLYSKEKQKGIFTAYCFSLLYAACMHLSSNTGMAVIYNACALSTAFSVLLIARLLGEIATTRRWVAVGLAVALGVGQLAGEVIMDCRYFFGESLDVAAISEEITEGPMKGLVTMADKRARYETDLENIRALAEVPGRTVLFFRNALYGYLIADDLRMGSYSPWTSETVPDFSEGSRMGAYYRMHPDRVPDLIYADILTEARRTPEQWEAFASENGYALRRFSGGGLLLHRESQGGSDGI